jgi:hypothetical protein
MAASPETARDEPARSLPNERPVSVSGLAAHSRLFICKRDRRTSMSAIVASPVQQREVGFHPGMASSPVLQRLAPAWVVGICALLCACGSRHQATPDSSSTTVPPMAQSDNAEFHYDDPCSLLTPAEVEAALGAPLGTAPYRAYGSNPNPRGTDCIYQTANFQDVTLSVTFKGGQQAYHIGDFIGGLIKGSNGVINDKAKKAMVSEDGSQIAGEWDEAKLTPFNCCIFDALRADQMITIDFTGSTMTLKQAAGLVDAAFKRIDKPLSLDGGANVAAAAAFLKTRPQRKDPCSVLTQAEVEAILGKLAAAPKSDDDVCSYQLPQQPGFPPRIYSLQFFWSYGNDRFRSDLHTAGIAGAALGGMTIQTIKQVQITTPAAGRGAGGTGSPASVTETKDVAQTISVDEASRRMVGKTFSQTQNLAGAQDATDTGPWERIAAVGPGLEAVKKDVLVKASLGFGVDQGRARALLAAVMKKI